MGATTRKATLTDLPILLKFEQALIKAERPMDSQIMDGDISYYSISDLIKNSESEVYIVEIENEIVASGYVKIKENFPYLKQKKQGYLGFMFVPENHRGNGYNQRVLDALLAWCKKRGVFDIRLDVYAVNAPAIKAYSKAGFKNHLINMRLDIENLDL